MTSHKFPKQKNNSFRQKIYKYFFIFLIAFASLFLLTLAVLPTALSTSWGKKQVESYLSKKLNKSLTFQTTDFSFLGTQKIEGLKIEDENQKFLLELSSATINQSFPDLIFQGVKDTHIIFSDLNLKLNDVSLKNVNGDVNLSPLLVHLNGFSTEGDVEGEFNLDIALDGVDFDEISELFFDPELFLTSNADLKAVLTAKNCPSLLLDSLFSSLVPNFQPDFFTTLFGERINLSLNKLKSSDDNHLTLDLSAVSANFSANIILEFGQNEIFIRQPGTLSLKIDQSFLKKNLGTDFGFELTEPITLVAHLENFNLPFDLKTGQYDFLKLALKGNVDFQEALLKSKTNLPDLFLQKFSTVISAEKESDSFSFQLEGDAVEKNQPIKIAAKTKLHKSLDLKKHKMPPTTIDLNHIPVVLLDHFFNLDNALLKAIGSHANLELEATPAKGRVDLVLKFDSEKLSFLPVKLKLDRYLTLQEPLKFEYRLTKEIAEKLLPENAFLSINSDKPIQATLNFEPIQNIHEIGEFFPEVLQGSLFIDQLSFFVKDSNKEIFFEKIDLPWKFDSDDKKVNLDFSGISRSSNKTKETKFSGKAELQKESDSYLFDIAFNREKDSGDKSDLLIKGNAKNLFTDNGSLNLYGLTLDLDAKINNLPTPLFCKIACLDKSFHQKIEVLFGKILNGNLHTSIKELDGIIKANVTGEDGTLTLDAFVEDGTLFLHKPFEAKFKVTPRLGKSILQDILPFLSGVIESDQPIVFTVQNEGFSFPLKKFDLSKIEVTQGFLSLGHVKFDNSGELAAILNLLTKEDASLISVWFTPLYFNVHQGTFRSKRVDMLISNEFPIAAWGKIDLIRDKVKMMIGMSGRALTHAFKVKDLDDNYMLQIPLIGKTSKATIDKPTATAKMGALLAQNHGGPKGLVLGTVLSLAGGALSEKKAPTPTTVPLPWEDQMTKLAEEDLKDLSILNELSVEEVASEKKDGRKKQKINKLLEDEANNLFKKSLNSTIPGVYSRLNLKNLKR